MGSATFSYLSEVRESRINAEERTGCRKILNVRTKGTEKIERLEHKTYAAKPQVSEKFVRGCSCDFMPHHFNTTGGHMVDAADQVEQCRFTTATWTPQDYKFTLAYGTDWVAIADAHALQRLNGI